MAGGGVAAAAAAPAAAAADNAAENGTSMLGLDTAALLKCITLGAAGPGQCFW
jgi:hypothetical protein